MFTHQKTVSLLTNMFLDIQNCVCMLFLWLREIFPLSIRSLSDVSLRVILRLLAEHVRVYSALLVNELLMRAIFANRTFAEHCNLVAELA